jgi:hypothetical protein
MTFSLGLVYEEALVSAGEAASSCNAQPAIAAVNRCATQNPARFFRKLLSRARRRFPASRHGD